LSAQLLAGRSDFRLDGLSLDSPGVHIEGHGDPDRGVHLTASLNLGDLQRQAADLIDFGGLDLAGKATLSADYHRAGTTFAGKMDADVEGLQIEGPLSVRRDTLHVDATLDGPASS